MMIWNTAVLASLVVAAAPETVDWKESAPLLGTWEADRSDNGATGAFTLSVELQRRILLRKNHADYPKTKERAAFRHEDLMVLWRDGSAIRSEYWDSEGHFIRYVVRVDTGSKTFTFVSDVIQGQPRYRLTYVASSPNALSLKFEIAPPDAPEQYKPYITATMHRVH
jgi:hypothetical protein